jgi:hypothetical protein
MCNLAYRMAKENKPKRGPNWEWRIYSTWKDLMLRDCRTKIKEEYILIRLQTNTVSVLEP